jgi:hypothetical protein
VNITFKANEYSLHIHLNLLRNLNRISRCTLVSLYVLSLQYVVPTCYFCSGYVVPHVPYMACLVICTPARIFFLDNKPGGKGRYGSSVAQCSVMAPVPYGGVDCSRVGDRRGLKRLHVSVRGWPGGYKEMSSILADQKRPRI